MVSPRPPGSAPRDDTPSCHRRGWKCTHYQIPGTLSTSCQISAYRTSIFIGRNKRRLTTRVLYMPPYQQKNTSAVMPRTQSQKGRQGTNERDRQTDGRLKTKTMYSHSRLLDGRLPQVLGSEAGTPYLQVERRSHLLQPYVRDLQHKTKKKNVLVNIISQTVHAGSTGAHRTIHNLHQI